MNKSTLFLLGILAFWVAILIAVFEFHIGIPVRAMFFMAFLSVAWLSYWTFKTIRAHMSEPTITKTENSNTSESGKSVKIG